MCARLFFVWVEVERTSRQSLPLEGKVPNASEADEVERESLLQLDGRANGPCYPSLPWRHGEEKMPPHPSADAASVPSRGSQWVRQKAAPARKSLLHSIPRRLFAQIWPRMLQTLRPTQGMSLTQNSIRTSRSTARAGTRRKTGIPLPKGRITASESKIFKPGPTRCGKSIFCPEIPWRKICPSQYDDK